MKKAFLATLIATPVVASVAVTVIPSESLNLGSIKSFFFKKESKESLKLTNSRLGGGGQKALTPQAGSGAGAGIKSLDSNHTTPNRYAHKSDENVKTFQHFQGPKVSTKSAVEDYSPPAIQSSSNASHAPSIVTSRQYEDETFRSSPQNSMKTSSAPAGKGKAPSASKTVSTPVAASSGAPVSVSSSKSTSSGSIASSGGATTPAGSASTPAGSASTPASSVPTPVGGATTPSVSPPPAPAMPAGTPSAAPSSSKSVSLLAEIKSKLSSFKSSSSGSATTPVSSVPTPVGGATTPSVSPPPAPAMPAGTPSATPSSSKSVSLLAGIQNQLAKIKARFSSSSTSGTSIKPVNNSGSKASTTNNANPAPAGSKGSNTVSNNTSTNSVASPNVTPVASANNQGTSSAMPKIKRPAVADLLAGKGTLKKSQTVKRPIIDPLKTAVTDKKASLSKASIQKRSAQPSSLLAAIRAKKSDSKLDLTSFEKAQAKRKAAVSSTDNNKKASMLSGGANFGKFSAFANSKEGDDEDENEDDDDWGDDGWDDEDDSDDGDSQGKKDDSDSNVSSINPSVTIANLQGNANSGSQAPVIVAKDQSAGGFKVPNSDLGPKSLSTASNVQNQSDQKQSQSSPVKTVDFKRDDSGKGMASSAMLSNDSSDSGSKIVSARGKKAQSAIAKIMENSRQATATKGASLLDQIQRGASLKDASSRVLAAPAPKEQKIESPISILSKSLSNRRVAMGLGEKDHVEQVNHNVDYGYGHDDEQQGFDDW